MTPGLGFFYMGQGVSRNNVMQTLLSSMIAMPVVTLQWFVWGYSLAFSPYGCKFIGDLNFAGFHNVAVLDFHPNAPTVNHMAFAFFQMMFAIVTPAIIFSGGAERLKMGPFVIFLVIWSTIVYDIIAYWAWAPNGWFRVLGGMDFAGGMAVETASGFSSLAVALALGPRKKRAKGSTNAPMVILGGALLWFGWIGFNAGSEGAANARASNAAMVTHLTACVAAATWMLCEYILHKKVGNVALINGAVAGLVCVTPAAGYILAPSCLALGVVSGVACYCMSKLRKRFADDSFDAFAVHGVAGFLGLLLTGIFAEKDIISLDGTATEGGWIDRHFIQLAYQLAGACAAAGWAFCLTFAIVKIMMWVAKCAKVSIVHDDQENIDDVELGECAHAFIEPNKVFSEDKSMSNKNVDV